MDAGIPTHPTSSSERRVGRNRGRSTHGTLTSRFEAGLRRTGHKMPLRLERHRLGLDLY